MAATRTAGPGGTTEDPLVGMFFSVEAGATIGYFTEVSGLAMEYEVEEYKEGGVNDFVHKLRGRAKFPNLVLKRGITSNEEFTKWFVGVPREDRAARADAHDVRPDAEDRSGRGRSWARSRSSGPARTSRRTRTAPRSRPSRSPTRA